MNTAQQLLSNYNDLRHESFNDLRALLQASLEVCLSADQNFDCGSIQYTFKDGSDLTISTHHNVDRSTIDSVNLTVNIRASS